jgi:hypothetical protein
MYSHDAVIHLSPIAIPLSPNADCLLAALGHARLVHGPDGLWMSMILGYHLLATVSQLLLVPLDRFQKSL